MVCVCVCVMEEEEEQRQSGKREGLQRSESKRANQMDKMTDACTNLTQVVKDRGKKRKGAETEIDNMNVAKSMGLKKSSGEFEGNTKSNPPMAMVEQVLQHC